VTSVFVRLVHDVKGYWVQGLAELPIGLYHGVNPETSNESNACTHRLMLAAMGRSCDPVAIILMSERIIREPP
jgi:hypothetical protein